MKGKIRQTRWVTLADAIALCACGWRILSYGTGPLDGVLVGLG